MASLKPCSEEYASLFCPTIIVISSEKPCFSSMREVLIILFRLLKDQAFQEGSLSIMGTPKEFFSNETSNQPFDRWGAFQGMGGRSRSFSHLNPTVKATKLFLNSSKGEEELKQKITVKRKEIFEFYLSFFLTGFGEFSTKLLTSKNDIFRSNVTLIENEQVLLKLPPLFPTKMVELVVKTYSPETLVHLILSILHQKHLIVFSKNPRQLWTFFNFFFKLLKHCHFTWRKPLLMLSTFNPSCSDLSYSGDSLGLNESFGSSPSSCKNSQPFPLIFETKTVSPTENIFNFGGQKTSELQKSFFCVFTDNEKAKSHPRFSEAFFVNLEKEETITSTAQGIPKFSSKNTQDELLMYLNMIHANLEFDELNVEEAFNSLGSCFRDQTTEQEDSKTSSGTGKTVQTGFYFTDDDEKKTNFFKTTTNKALEPVIEIKIGMKKSMEKYWDHLGIEKNKSPSGNEAENVNSRFLTLKKKALININDLKELKTDGERRVDQIGRNEEPRGNSIDSKRLSDANSFQEDNENNYNVSPTNHIGQLNFKKTQSSSSWQQKQPRDPTVSPRRPPHESQLASLLDFSKSQTNTGKDNTPQADSLHSSLQVSGPNKYDFGTKGKKNEHSVLIKTRFQLEDGSSNSNALYSGISSQNYHWPPSTGDRYNLGGHPASGTLGQNQEFAHNVPGGISSREKGNSNLNISQPKKYEKAGRPAELLTKGGGYRNFLTSGWNNPAFSSYNVENGNSDKITGEVSPIKGKREQQSESPMEVWNVKTQGNEEPVSMRQHSGRYKSTANLLEGTFENYLLGEIPGSNSHDLESMDKKYPVYVSKTEKPSPEYYKNKKVRIFDQKPSEPPFGTNNINVHSHTRSFIGESPPSFQTSIHPIPTISFQDPTRFQDHYCISAARCDPPNPMDAIKFSPETYRNHSKLFQKILPGRLNQTTFNHAENSQNPTRSYQIENQNQNNRSTTPTPGQTTQGRANHPSSSSLITSLISKRYPSTLRHY